MVIIVLTFLSDLNVPDLTQKTELKEIFQLIQKFTNIAKDNPPSVTIYKIMRNETDIYKKIANDDTVEHFIQRSILNDILESAYDLEKIKSDATMSRLFCNLYNIWNHLMLKLKEARQIQTLSRFPPFTKARD